jgi:RelA/SpoT family (p)ppGpp synthetase
MLARQKSLDEIYDLFAIRIILDTDNDNDCFAVYGIVSEIYIPIPERFKNFISLPKKNGYQSIHTTVIGPNGKMVEVQIRTKAMHEVAERGVAAHWKYKENISSDDGEFEDWITWVREIFEHQSEENASPGDFMENFKLSLYQDEIYVFTPKGDLKILPKGATPVDFAFEVHSQVGLHCIGAKVNGRIVPLDTKLSSGDQIEIITSKNQTPNKDWEQFVVTHKAKVQIRKFINEEKRERADLGKELWEKRLKKSKMHLGDDEFARLLHSFRFDNAQKFYLAVGSGEINVDELVEEIKEKGATFGKETEAKPGAVKTEEQRFHSYVREARSVVPLLVEGQNDDLMLTYAKCCNPVPGDDVIGFVTMGQGIKVHRRNCRNIENLMRHAETTESSIRNRLVDISWPANGASDFIAGMKISGLDRPGILNDITHAISTYMNTNIRSVNIDTKDSMFEGSIIIWVKNTEHLNRLIEKILKINGVFSVERFDG